MPADFKAPAGSNFKFDPADPALAAFRTVAHEEGLTQQGYSKALGAYAAVKIAEQAKIDAGLKAEQGALGSAAGTRVDNVIRFLDSSGLGVLKSSLITAAQVEAWESHITKLTSQGGAPFSQSHRVPPEDGKIPNYEKLSYAQIRAAQDARKTA